MVANLGFLTPYRLPGLIECACVNAFHLKAVMERPAWLTIHFPDILVPENNLLGLKHTAHLISEMTRPDHGSLTVIQ